MHHRFLLTDLSVYDEHVKHCYYVKINNEITKLICHSQITIPIAQFIKNANNLPNVLIFYKIADILILIHFGLDPFIYVLMKTNYWMRFKNFVCELKLCKTHKKKFLALPSSTLDCQL